MSNNERQQIAEEFSATRRVLRPASQVAMDSAPQSTSMYPRSLRYSTPEGSYGYIRGARTRSNERSLGLIIGLVEQMKASHMKDKRL